MTDKKPHLSTVPKELPDPPYPASTKANGFRVEFDIRRIKQSKTWLLARPEVRNALLRLWVEVWESVPCGSLDDDDELIAARLEVSDEWLRGHRQQLMRGWYKCSDGRLYHQYISDLVLAMLGRREMGAQRQAKFRTAKGSKKRNASVTRNNASVTVRNDAEQEQEQEQEIGANAPIPQTPRDRGENPRAKGTNPRAQPAVIPGGLSLDAWDEYQRHRRAIRARKLTPSGETRLQQWLADQGPPEIQTAIVDQSIRNGWTGLFELKGKAGKGAANAAALDDWINQGNTIEGELDD